MNIEKKHFDNVSRTCKTFGCVPYLALVIDEGTCMTMYLLSQKRLFDLYPEKKEILYWSMKPEKREQYDADSEIIKMKFNYEIKDWWK